MWGNATAQIFGSVSGRMHWEFALKHEMRWLERWGLTYYGCCEPLDIKMGLMRRIPNLRKISMSPWVNTERAVKEVGADYVFSRKPTPAVLAEDTWRPERARADLARFLGASTRLPHRAHHEGYFDRPLSSAAPVGVGKDRDGAG